MKTDLAAGRGGTTPPALWDPVVRITHWGVALSVLANALLSQGGSVVHVWIGWGAMVLLVLRLVWGLADPAEARFSAFPPSLAAALAHLRGLVRGRGATFPSHNPAGALMVYAFWAAIAVAIGSGLAMTGTTPLGVMALNDAVARGDFAFVAAHPLPFPESVAKAAEAVHEAASSALLLMAALHVAGVLVESRVMKTSLLRPMLFGSRTRR